MKIELKKRKKRQKRSAVSLRGVILSKIVSLVNAEYLIGVQAGQKESKWKCPETLQMEEIIMEHFSMEYLSRKEGRREDFVILQLHGGGYVAPLRDIYRSFAGLYNELSDGADVLTIDYRVAPEHPYPAALEDAVCAYEWLLTKGFSSRQIILAGDSAGGGLSLALCLYLKDRGGALPSGLILMSPWADLTASGSSYQENYTKDSVFGNHEDPRLYGGDYPGGEDTGNPYISPVFGDYEGFPPLLIQVGSDEMLLSDSITVTEKARAKGGKVRLSIYEGMFHLFQMALKALPESVRAWREVRRFLKEIAPSP